MAFKFSLSTLLRLKEIAADREERLIGQIQGQIAQTNQTLDDLKGRREREISRREINLQQSSSAAEIVSSYTHVSSLEAMQQTVQDQLAKLEVLRLQQMKVYELAYRNKELLAGIKEDQHEEFLYDRARREQMTMDDNFSSRRLPG